MAIQPVKRYNAPGPTLMTRRREMYKALMKVKDNGIGNGYRWMADRVLISQREDRNTLLLELNKARKSLSSAPEEDWTNLNTTTTTGVVEREGAVLSGEGMYHV
ncbi:hypothetical protein VKT23_012950 [Stygiomarasmius scandens]|uniref:Uncharacterized protein n=1 Tax=Marasmiellus scandens TaxID=2682957 RepID=A0ABR1J9R3_9AGAR